MGEPAGTERTAAPTPAHTLLLTPDPSPVSPRTRQQRPLLLLHLPAQPCRPHTHPAPDFSPPCPPQRHPPPRPDLRVSPSWPPPPRTQDPTPPPAPFSPGAGAPRAHGLSPASSLLSGQAVPPWPSAPVAAVCPDRQMRRPPPHRPQGLGTCRQPGIFPPCLRPAARMPPHTWEASIITGVGPRRAWIGGGVRGCRLGPDRPRQAPQGPSSVMPRAQLRTRWDGSAPNPTGPPAGQSSPSASEGGDKGS